MFDVVVDSDPIDGDVTVGDLISLLTIVGAIVLFCWSCNWTVVVDGKLFDVVTSDTWHGSRFICNKYGSNKTRNQTKKSYQTDGQTTLAESVGMGKKVK